MLTLQESPRSPLNDEWTWGAILSLSSVLFFVLALLLLVEVVTPIRFVQTLALVAGIVVVLSAVASRLGYGLLASLLVGVVPAQSYPVAHVYTTWGETHTVVELLRRIFAELWVTSSVAVPLATVGFLVGVTARYRNERHGTTDWIRRRVAIAVVLILVLWSAVYFDLIARQGGGF